MEAVQKKDRADRALHYSSDKGEYLNAHQLAKARSGGLVTFHAFKPGEYLLLVIKLAKVWSDPEL